ncbi:hypothetical protein ACHAWF_007526 [Thalassiosira exigua]
MKPSRALPAAAAAVVVAFAVAAAPAAEPIDRRRAQGIFNIASPATSSSAAATANEAPPAAEPAAPAPELPSGGAFTLEEFISSASSASDPFAASEVDDEDVPAPPVASSPAATATEAAPASGAGGVPVVELGFDGAEVDLSSLSDEETAALLESFPPPASSATAGSTTVAEAPADESVVGANLDAPSLDAFISSAAGAQDAFAATEVQGGGAAASSTASVPDVAEDVGQDSLAPPAQTSQPSQGSSLPAGWGQGDSLAESLAPPVQATTTEYDLDLAGPVVDRPAEGPTPAYTDEACARWLSGLLAADFDNSGGVSEAEFVTFLRTINEPPAVANYLKQRTDGAYADLPWLLQLVHKTLACRCEDLGKGEGCCEGDEPEIPLDGLGTDWRQSGGAGGAGGPAGDMTPPQLQMAAEYRADACNLIDVVFQETVPATEPPAPVPASTIDGASGGEEEEDEQLAQAVPSDPTNANEPATTPGDNGQGPGPGGAVSGVAPGSAPTPAPPVAIVNAVGSVLAYDEHGDVTVQQYRLGVVPNARAVRMDSASAGKALDHVSSAFVDLANKVMLDYASYGWQAELDAAAKETRAADVEGGGGRRIRGLQQDQEKAMLPKGSYVALPPAVTDVVCPSGLAYAPSGGYCLNFKFEVHTPNMTEEFATVFSDKMAEEIDAKGELYKIVEADYPNTIVQGLGRPGSGVDGTAREVDAPQVDAPQQGASAEKPEETEKHWTDDLPIPVWAMVLIAVAVVLIPMAIIALYLRQRKRAREVDSGRSFRGESPYKRDVEAPPVAEMNSIRQESSERMNQKVEMHREISVLAKQTNQSMSSRQLLDAYQGKEEVLLSHLRRVKENQETDAAASSNSPGAPGAGQKKEVATSAGSAAAGGKGTTASTGSAAGVEKSKKEEVTKLVEANDIPQTADELLAAYKGNEDTLINHLKKLSSSKLKDSMPKDSADA